MTAPERASAACEPRPLGAAAVMTAVSQPDGIAALIERLAAIDAAMRIDLPRLPAAVIEEIARMSVSGATVPEIAARTGVSQRIVRDRLRRAGADEYLERNRHVREVLKSRAAELIAAYEAGATITALAADAGVCRPTLSTFLVAQGIRLRHDRGWYRRRRHVDG
jgi:hypothetical protein